MRRWSRASGRVLMMRRVEEAGCWLSWDLLGREVLRDETKDVILIVRSILEQVITLQIMPVQVIEQILLLALHTSCATQLAKPSMRASAWLVTLASTSTGLFVSGIGFAIIAVGGEEWGPNWVDYGLSFWAEKLFASRRWCISMLAGVWVGTGTSDYWTTLSRTA